MSPLPSLLPLKKRAINYSSVDGSSPDPDDPSSSSPKKRRVNNGSAVAVAESEAPAVPRGPRQRRRPVPAAVAAAAASARADAQLSGAAKWLQKCKWVVTEQEDTHPAAAPAPPPPAKKFMQDGIRSFAATAARDDEKNKTAAAAVAEPAIGEALRLRLAELGATRPVFVYRKPLRKSDVCSNQNRLLVSCKRETLEGCPITPVFSPREWARVENKEAGLLVTALDARGEPHALTCKFLDSNGGYRFISGWTGFLRRNGVALDSRGRWTRGVDVEVLAFRSRALPRQPPVDAGGRLDWEMEVDDHLHPDGSLGLILLLHEHAGRRRADEVDDDGDDGDYDEGTGSPPAAREKKGKKQGAKRDAAAVAREGAGAEVGGEEASMSKVEMVGKYGESMSNMVVGMIMLRGTISMEKESLPDNVKGDAVAKEESSRDVLEGGAVPKEEESRENVEGERGQCRRRRRCHLVEGDANLKAESRGNVEGGAILEDRRDNVEGADIALN